MNRRLAPALATLLLVGAMAHAKLPMGMVPTPQPRRLFARLVCGGESPVWWISTPGGDLHLRLPDDTTDAAVATLSLSEPRCLQPVRDGAILELMITNDSATFHPSDSGDLPTSARLSLLLETDTDETGASRIRDASSLLFSRRGRIRHVPVEVTAPAAERSARRREIANDIAAAPFKGTWWLAKSIGKVLYYLVLSPYILVMLLFGGFTCSGPGCH